MRVWDRASLAPAAVDGRIRPELAALSGDFPSLADLFTFMRDAETRFTTLRMRIEERSFGTRGEQLLLIEVAIRHPGAAKVTTSDPGRGTKGNYDVWLSDGTTVRTYSGISKVATERPVRRDVRGLDNRDLPGTSTVYQALTTLPMESLPETFVHPAGFCQNVLATGDCRISGTADQADREALVLDCFHPRTVEVTADRPDHHLQVWVDRETGIISRLMETIGGQVTRDALVTSLEPDVTLPIGALDFRFPSDARRLF